MAAKIVGGRLKLAPGFLKFVDCGASVGMMLSSFAALLRHPIEVRLGHGLLGHHGDRQQKDKQG